MAKPTKKEVVELLEQFALLLELKDANRFKIRAFQNGARALETEPAELSDLMKPKELEKIKGIGKGISTIVRDLWENGKSTEFDDLKSEFPETLFELFNVPGLGAKRVKVLYEKLGIESLGELEYACTENRLVDLDGFGVKSQEKVLKGIEHLKKTAGYYLINVAKFHAKRLTEYLKKQKGITKIEIAGSIRRHKEIIRDIDILVSAKDPQKIHDAFVKYKEVESVVGHGETKSSVTLKAGMNCDLRTVKESEFPFALQYFTGSKEHNVELRSYAKRKGYKINEYELTKDGKRIACKSEEEIYKKLGLHYVPPEARENRGEVTLVQKKEFPRLVEEKDIKGIFHVHTTASDGAASLEEIVKASEKLGYEYIGISDHSQSAFYANGLDEKRIFEQFKEIDALQKKVKIRIFKGIEADILPDGKLDYPDKILKEFDFVIGSIHSVFNKPEKETTRRLARAMENKYLSFVGHPTGRLLLGREGYALNMKEVIECAKKEDVCLELNASPHRLDVDWRVLHAVREQGVSVSINPDAHSLEGLKDVCYGVGIARKGWLTSESVVNAKPLNQIEKYLKRRL